MSEAPPRRLVAIGVALLAGAVALALLLPTLDVTDSPFSAYGDGDTDTSILVNGMRTQGFQVSSLTLGPTALEGVDATRTDAFYLSVGVDRGFTEPELDALFDFADEGGIVVVMDDTGASESLLQRVGLQKGSILLSTTGGQPSVVPVQIGNRLANLWQPVELVPAEDADVTVLARAGNTTAKDTNGNEQIDPEEPTCAGGCVVATRSDVGTGAVYVIGDPTFATNKYATSAGAIPVLQGITEEHTTGRRALVVVDESRHVAGPAEVGLTLFRLLELPVSVTGVPFAAAGLVGVASVYSYLRRGEQTWPDHDPAFSEPYLREDTDEEGGPP